MKRLFQAILFILVLQSCRSIDKAKSDATKDADLSGQLKEQSLGKSAIFISLPADYQIEETKGIDFTVYYFLPKDATRHNTGTGGIYLGGHPGRIGPQGDNCQKETRSSDMLGQSVEWTIYNCINKLSLETVIPLDAYERIHVFGQASTKEEADKLIEIFSTIRKR